MSPWRLKHCLLALAFLHGVCGGARVATDWRNQPVLFEISTRPWLYQLAQSGVIANCGQYVCLRDVPSSEWQRIADDGIEIVWLMGVWQLGPYGLLQARSPKMMKSYRNELPDVEFEDVIGSPYAIQSYTLNSDIGTHEDLAAVRSTLWKFGLRLMLDFVPNHFAVDAQVLHTNRSIFLEKPPTGDFSKDWWIELHGRSIAHGRSPFDDGWTDTLQVNYWNPVAVDLMIELLMGVAEHADAIRCDMSMLILNDVISRTWGEVMQANGFHRPAREFWNVAIRAIRKKHPGIYFLAEAYNYGFTNPPEKQMLREVGFDAVYDKRVLDELGKNNLDSLRGYISGQSQDFFEHTAHFVENHDEPRSAKALGQKQAFVGAVVAATLPGLRLFFSGQFEGFSARLQVQLRRASQESANIDLQLRYKALLHALSHDVFHSGSWTFISTPKDGSGWRLSAWRWSAAEPALPSCCGGSNGTAKRLVVVNFSDEPGTAKVQVADAQAAAGSDVIAMTDVLSGFAFQRLASELRSAGLECHLPPWSAQIIAYDGPGDNIFII